MAKHTSKKSDITREHIVEAASDLFRQYGVHEVSLNKIMAEIDMTPGGFYKYFRSKEMLAAEACARSFRQTQDACEEQIARAQRAARNPYRYLISQYLSLSEKGNCSIGAFSRDASDASHDKSFSQVYRVGVQSILSMFVGAAQEQEAERCREQALVHFAAMLGVGLLSRSVASESWVAEIKSALLNQLS
ncbi:TetR/AcrR family transcriptional regulator [Pseudomonas sp. RGM2987]|uniref:TetR/AcrR family transcriptional regulator n=1 Tax=Pseudomonas sp. RGM2987 TaxID=2930090 RepID=UPI001FD70D7C|nr:TetR/AcrR family transcriptional regulator [Pseudomonas sp. RGM2987]MCJ8206423.1 TetR/AcrR family transcriptional regulator [Pseudomonas sp. RGM2987]